MCCGKCKKLVHTENYIRVYTENDKALGNELLKTRLIAHNENGLWGELETQEAESLGVRG
jgi:hypothetical protein